MKLVPQSESNVPNVINGFVENINSITSIFDAVSVDLLGSYDDVLSLATSLVYDVSIHDLKKDMIKNYMGGIETVGIPNKNGKLINYNVEKKVVLDIRNDFKNCAQESTLARNEELDSNLIIWSTHSNARIGCEDAEGKVFSMDGTSGMAEDWNGNMYEFEPIENSTYGEPDGIGGINCGHQMYTFVAMEIVYD